MKLKILEEQDFNFFYRINEILYIILKIFKFNQLKINSFNIKIIFLIFISLILIIEDILKNFFFSIINFKINNNEFKEIMEYLNLTGYKNITNKIKIAIYAHSLKNGGVEKLTSLLLNYLSKIKLFELYLFTDIISFNEYELSNKVKRIIIFNGINFNLKRKIIINKINIFIYQNYDINTMKMLKTLKDTKIIFYNHSCFLYWIYINDISTFNMTYNEYKNSNYVISLIHFENDYLFKKWGIKSLYMNNYMTYDYNKVKISDLSSRNILMIGRGDDINKRFDLGIISMKYIIEEIHDCKMIIISDKKGIKYLKDLSKELKLEDNINFVGYTNYPEIFYRNASLHIFPSISEAFPMVLNEVKIYGIPSILLGIDYVSTSKEGVCVIYDDNPKTIAKFSINILNNETLRKRLGKEARQSMKKFNNDLLTKKWAKLFISIYLGKNYYDILYKEDEKISEKEAISIIENQVKLLKMRKKINNITVNDLLNFTFIKNFNNY